MINIAVCDDDLEITKSINKLLMKYQDERDLDFTVDLFNDGSGLKSSILKGKKYDLIYLDIEMRQMNGIATAKYIRSIDTTVLLIYVSNYDNYLKELFEVEPFRFMSKPINDKRFYIIINYDKVRIRHGDFKMIFDIRCKTQAPLLVILEGCEIRDKLHVLNMKADDYIEKPINIDELEEKMLQLLHKLS